MNLLAKTDMALGLILERLCNLRPAFMPADLARPLKREALGHELRSLSGRLAPDYYELHLPAVEMERLEPIQEEIEQDLVRYLEELFRTEGLNTANPVRVRLGQRPVSEGLGLKISSSFGQEAVS